MQWLLQGTTFFEGVYRTYMRIVLPILLFTIYANAAIRSGQSFPMSYHCHFHIFPFLDSTGQKGLGSKRTLRQVYQSPLDELLDEYEYREGIGGADEYDYENYYDPGVVIVKKKTIMYGLCFNFSEFLIYH
ncbi:hypothetical protein Y032_0129g1489 [Ancylostoma ceylanicum]|uniref:Uncharacterized protein n=1 Tax=Ancylostoma ceylanicum TaxID=53326 RepID=A0A016T7P8_9BILA|nr:hypothetical protein Y032_0129g1489 [Ancylostoma ceylanicum]